MPKLELPVKQVLKKISKPRKPLRLHFNTHGLTPYKKTHNEGHIELVESGEIHILVENKNRLVVISSDSLTLEVRSTQLSSVK